MRKVTILLLIALIGAIPSFGQSLEEDNIILFAKANILFESGRYDEAVRMYNSVLRNNENHTNALLMRARAKYELGAYKGTKNDALSFIEKVGVTKELVVLMAQTEWRLSNLDAALNYGELALELDPYDASMYLLAGEIALESDMRNNACEYFATAVQLGNARASRRMNDYCNGNIPHRETTNVEIPVEEPRSEIDSRAPTTERDDSGIVSLEDIVREAEDKNGEVKSSTIVNKNVVQDIEIDDKLMVAVTNGIGHRNVESKPSIFMLSDQDGTVVIDVCLNGNGLVTEAVFNRDDSTIFRSSLTSLALRKAKGFQFESSDEAEECGVMVFYIKS